MRTRNINVRLTEEEYRWLKDYTARTGNTMSALIIAELRKIKADDERTRKPQQF